MWLVDHPNAVRCAGHRRECSSGAVHALSDRRHTATSQTSCPRFELGCTAVSTARHDGGTSAVSTAVSTARHDGGTSAVSTAVSTARHDGGTSAVSTAVSTARHDGGTSAVSTVVSTARHDGRTSRHAGRRMSSWRLFGWTDHRVLSESPDTEATSRTSDPRVELGRCVRSEPRRCCGVHSRVVAKPPTAKPPLVEPQRHRGHRGLF